MTDYIANFELSQNNIDADFSLENTEFDALFEINPAGANWGSITGHIEDQTDLYNTLNAKADITALNQVSSNLTALTVTVGDNYTVLDGRISALSTTVSDNYSTLDNRLDTAEGSILNLADTVSGNYTELNGKITTNANNITSIYNTMDNYGDIVSYNAADFATKNQGLLAESALQPNNNITLLNNNAGYITNAVNNLANYYLKSETYTKTEVQNLISGITGITIEVVSELPVSGENGVIYLVPKEGASPDIYNEYIWVETDEDFELIGNTEIDLTDYATRVYVDTGLALKANDNAVVHLSGNETIDGEKTFNDATYFKGTIASISSTSDPTSLNFRGGTNGITFSIGAGEKVKLTNQLLNVTTPINATTPSQSETENKRVTTIGYINSKLADYVETSDLSTVATTGDFDDLINQPTIGNGTITFTQGGVTKGTITTNQSGNTTIDFDAGGGGGAVDSVNGQTGTVVLTASDVGALADTTTIPSKTSDLTNDSGFITGITSSDVTTALGYTPYNSTNPSGYITSSALNGYATETWVGNQGYITGITSSDVITALTYTPYNGATNPNGYITSSALSDYVDLASAQDISGRKTFLGEKAIYFKQQATTNKLGFTLYNPSNTELAAFEYRPSTIGANALLNINTSYSNACYVGFRYWGTAVNIIAPKVATAGNYYIPTHITDGTNTVTASNTGTVNISTLLPDSEVFIVEYGEMYPLQDIEDAYLAGKVVICQNGITQCLLTKISGTSATFTLPLDDNNDCTTMSMDAGGNWNTSTTRFFDWDDYYNNIPTAISDLTDDTSTTPIDKADTLTGLTASVAELNYTDGVTSNIQTQLDSKADVTLSNVSSIDNNSAVKTALDTKVNSADIWYDSTTSTLYIGVAQS